MAERAGAQAPACPSEGCCSSTPTSPAERKKTMAPAFPWRRNACTRRSLPVPARGSSLEKVTGMEKNTGRDCTSSSPCVTMGKRADLPVLPASSSS